MNLRYGPLNLRLASVVNHVWDMKICKDLIYLTTMGLSKHMLFPSPKFHLIPSLTITCEAWMLRQT